MNGSLDVFFFFFFARVFSTSRTLPRPTKKHKTSKAERISSNSYSPIFFFQLKNLEGNMGSWSRR